MEQPCPRPTAPPDARSEAPPSPPPLGREDPVSEGEDPKSEGRGADSEPSDEAASLDRPAFEDAQIRIRPGGRQLVIERGGTPDADEQDTNELVGDGDPSNSSGEGERTPQADGEDSPEPAKRGEIKEFSEDARRRLRRTVHALDRDAASLFVTLTWHEVLPTPDEAHAALDRFWKRLRDRFPDAAALWKMEPQDRGHPHFHLLLYGVEWINPQWLSALWHDVTAETSEQHRKSGVDVEWIRGGQDGKLQSYLSTYFGKGEPWPEEAGEAWERPGRFWGKLERKNLPMAEWAEWAAYLSERDAAYLIRTLLDEWDVDTGGALPPSLTINTRGDPSDRLESLLDRL